MFTQVNHQVVVPVRPPQVPAPAPKPAARWSQRELVEASLRRLPDRDSR